MRLMYEAKQNFYDTFYLGWYAEDGTQKLFWKAYTYLPNVMFCTEGKRSDCGFRRLYGL